MTKAVLVADGDVESETVFSPLTDGDVVLPSSDVEGTFELVLNISKSIKSSLGLDVLQNNVSHSNNINENFIN